MDDVLPQLTTPSPPLPTHTPVLAEKAFGYDAADGLERIEEDNAPAIYTAGHRDGSVELIGQRHAVYDGLIVLAEVRFRSTS